MKFGGLFLFDELEHIGKWKEQNYRGYIEVWRKGKKIVVVEPYEHGEWEAWYGNEETGVWESIAVGKYDEVKKEAIGFMKAHQN